MSRQLTVLAGGHSAAPASNERTDNWWIGPVITLIVFTSFIIYTTWAALQGEYYYAGPYLSPFYSPLLLVDTARAGAAPLEHAWIGAWPTWWPALIPASPAILILIFPGAFRFTCYYYRKAYYRAFVGSPPACGVTPLATGKKQYKGETFLLSFQNLHRYALYFALLYVPILYYDACLALKYHGEWGFGVGTAIMFINPTLLGAYTFGCHALRHLVGGGNDCMSCGQNTMQYGTWKKVSWLNARHGLFAWVSLIWVAFTDIYIRLVSMGVWHDYNTWGGF